MGGQLARLLAGEEPADLGPPPGAEQAGRDPLLERVHTFLLTSVGQAFAGRGARRRTSRSPRWRAPWARTSRRRSSASGSSP